MSDVFSLLFEVERRNDTPSTSIQLAASGYWSLELYLRFQEPRFHIQGSFAWPLCLYSTGQTPDLCY